jgi:hypothetical protein
MAGLFKDPHALPYLLTTAELSTIKCKSKSGDSSAWHSQVIFVVSSYLSESRKARATISSTTVLLASA